MKIAKKIAGVIICYVLMSSHVFAQEVSPRAQVCPDCNAGRVIETLAGRELISATQVDCIHEVPFGYDVVEIYNLTYTYHCSENCGFRDFRDGVKEFNRLCCPF